MEQAQNLKELAASYTTATSDLTQPVLLEQDGQPVAVLMSIAEYKGYQALLATRQFISAAEARRAADHTVFGDLVGCALSSGDPIWAAEPQPHWRVPYRLFDGRLLTIVQVDARTAAVSLTANERIKLLEKIEHLATQAHVAV